MFYSLILLQSVLFVNFIHGEHACFCYCCSSKPCTLKMQSSFIQIDRCDQCKEACRARFSACQSTIKTGKFFPLCSNEIDKHLKLAKLVNDIVTIANTVFENTDNQTILQSELNGLEKLYEDNMEKDIVDDNHKEIPEKRNDFSDGTEIKVEEDNDGDHYHSQIVFSQKRGQNKAPASSTSTTSTSTSSIKTSTIVDVNPETNPSVTEKSKSSTARKQSQVVTQVIELQKQLADVSEALSHKTSNHTNGANKTAETPPASINSTIPTTPVISDIDLTNQSDIDLRKESITSNQANPLIPIANRMNNITADFGNGTVIQITFPEMMQQTKNTSTHLSTISVSAQVNDTIITRKTEEHSIVENVTKSLPTTIVKHTNMSESSISPLSTGSSSKRPVLLVPEYFEIDFSDDANKNNHSDTDEYIEESYDEDEYDISVSFDVPTTKTHHSTTTSHPHNTNSSHHDPTSKIEPTISTTTMQWYTTKDISGSNMSSSSIRILVFTMAISMVFLAL